MKIVYRLLGIIIVLGTIFCYQTLRNTKEMIGLAEKIYEINQENQKQLSYLQKQEDYIVGLFSGSQIDQVLLTTEQ